MGCHFVTVFAVFLWLPCSAPSEDGPHVVAVGQQHTGREREPKLSPLLIETEPYAPSQWMVVEFHQSPQDDTLQELMRLFSLTIKPHADLLRHELLIYTSVRQATALAQRSEIAYIYPASQDLVEGRPVHACRGGITMPQASSYSARTAWEDSGASREVPIRLYYFFSSLPRRMDPKPAQTEIMRALHEWIGVINVDLQPATRRDALRTLRVDFGSWSHGDNWPFDGPGGTLAHSFYPAPINPEPIAGDMHFDDDESWGAGADAMPDLFSVALHEAGHALGLGHSDLPGTVMYPHYRRLDGLTSLDLAAIWAQYPARPFPRTRCLPGTGCVAFGHPGPSGRQR